MMKISLKDSVTTYNDCVLRVEISRKDGLPFIFPSDMIVERDIPGVADLFIVIEKKNDGVFSDYMCKYLDAHNDDIYEPPAKYEKYTRLIFTDSLGCIVCLGSGQFRLRIDYNVRRADGFYGEPNIVLSSNWVYFFVKSDEIVLNEFFRKLKREHWKYFEKALLPYLF